MKKYSHSICRLVLHWGPPLTLTQALYNSTLAFTFYLDGARRPARYENVVFSGLLGACVLTLGMCMAFLISLVYAEALESSSSHIYLFLQPLPFWASWSVYCLS